MFLAGHDTPSSETSALLKNGIRALNHPAGVEGVPRGRRLSLAQSSIARNLLHADVPGPEPSFTDREALRGVRDGYTDDLGVSASDFSVYRKRSGSLLLVHR